MQLSSRPACITCEAGPPAGFHAYPDVYGGQVDMVLLARPRTAMGLTACARRDPCGRAATVGSIQLVFKSSKNCHLFAIYTLDAKKNGASACQALA